MTSLRLESDDARAVLRAARLMRDAGGWRAPPRKRARIISWRT
ncbi:MAG TPA: hypothetical protein VIE36_16735 [Methylomirabilota bacterium]|jgi:hypothetical protein